MASGRFRGLARRVKNKIQGNSNAVGDGFGPSQDAAFAHLDDAADSAFQLIGASLVSSWEVMLTDVSRAMDPNVPSNLTQEKLREMLERISDGLVPTQDPVRNTGKLYRRNLKKGVKHALQTGKLQDATAPLALSLKELGPEFHAGWTKTTEYLEPVLALLDSDGSVRAKFETSGAEMAEMFQKSLQEYNAAQAALPQSSDLKAAIVIALETWQQSVSRGLEISIYDCRTALVNASGRLGASE